MSESDIRGFLFSGPAYRSAHAGYASNPPCDLRAGLLRFARNDGGWRPWRHCEERMRRSNPVTACRSRRQWRSPDERKRHPGFSFLRSRISLRSCGLRISYTTHLLHAVTASSCAGLSRASMSYFLRGGPKTWMAGSSPAMTVQMSQEETVKPSRRECRNVRLICGDYTCVLALFAHKAAGAARHPAFPAPSNCWGRCSTELGRASSAARPRKLAVSEAK